MSTLACIHTTYRTWDYVYPVGFYALNAPVVDISMSLGASLHCCIAHCVTCLSPGTLLACSTHAHTFGHSSLVPQVHTRQDTATPHDPANTLHVLSMSSFLPSSPEAEIDILMKVLAPLYAKRPEGSVKAEAFLKSGADLGPVKAMLAAIGVRQTAPSSSQPEQPLTLRSRCTRSFCPCPREPSLLPHPTTLYASLTRKCRSYRMKKKKKKT